MQTLRVARVDDCQDRVAHITILPPPSCGGCAGCGACGRNPHGETYTLPVPYPLTPGTRIEVDFRTPNLAALSLLVFGMPLGLALFGGWIGSKTDMTLLLGGGVGLVVGFCLLWLLNRHVPQLRARVTFVCVVDTPNDSTPACGGDRAGAGAAR